MLRVLMLPTLAHTDSPGGINRVIEGWHKYAREYDIEYVSPEASSYDLLTSHAGSAHAQTGEWPDLAATHGLYWANDYAVSKAMLEINARVIQEARHAKAITVPSRWVAKTFQREMRLSPYVVPHGIDWKLWQHNEHCERYILWNKNRDTDACDPGVITDLALTYPEQQFVTTFASDDAPNNVHIIGTRPHNQMRLLVQKAGVYLSTARETFCIGALEAMASGVPVLGWDFGGNAELITHGVTGYLARDPDDLADGLLYCLDHRERLGANAREAARAYTWQATCEQVAGIYRAILKPHGRPMVIDPAIYTETTL